MIRRMSARPATANEDDGHAPGEEVAEFIRYCYRRRRVAWPELYDDMCAVAARGSFRGWGYEELAARGVVFTLPELPRLAAFVASVVHEERDTAGAR